MAKAETGFPKDRRTLVRFEDGSPALTLVVWQDGTLELEDSNTTVEIDPSEDIDALVAQWKASVGE